jgi:GDP-mannose 6-dehydrogenase
MLRQETHHNSLQVVDQETINDGDLDNNGTISSGVDRISAKSFSKLEKPQISIFNLDASMRVDAASLTFMGYQVHNYVTDEQQSLAQQKRITALLDTEASRTTVKPLEHKTVNMTSNVKSMIDMSQISMIMSESVAESSIENSISLAAKDDLVNQSVTLSHLSKLIGQALKQKTEYHLIIYRADLMPGMTENTLIPILEAASEKRCGEHFGVCVVPCFLGNDASISDYYGASKVIIGGNDNQATTIAGNLYKAHLNSAVELTSLKNAESVKLIENSWRAMKQTFHNEIDRVCRAANIDVQELLKFSGASTESHLSTPHESNFSYGGTELENDLSGISLLAKQYSVDLPLIENLTNSYDAHIDYAVETIRRYGRRKIGILGLTTHFKNSAVGSNLHELTARLEKLGYEVQIFDPTAQSLQVQVSDNLKGSSANNPDDSIRVQQDELQAQRCHSLDEFIRSNDIVVQTSNDSLFASCEERARLKSTVINLVSGVTTAHES